MGNEATTASINRCALRDSVTAWAKRVFIGSLAIALIGAVSTLGMTWPAAASQSVPLPASIPSDCDHGESTSALSAFLAGVPADSTVTFPADGCFIVNETLLLQDTTGLTIEGNGSTLRQTASPTNAAPIVELWDDANLTMENVKIDGAYDGSNGGEGEEGDYGIEFEADSGVTLTNDSVSNIQGDFLYLSPPYDVTTSDALSTGITITNSTFTNAGYHGLTVESVGCPTLATCNGLTISGDTFRGIGTDAMDFEYDDYSTPFNPNGTAYWAAEDDVTITHNTWIDWGDDWFASVQGQLPGVQEQHLTLSDNTLEADSPLFEVVGTNRADTTTASTNDYWTITGNTFVAGYYGAPYRGGDSVAGQLYFITNLKLENNTFPFCDGEYEAPQPVNTCTTPDEYVFDLDVITYGSIENNDFPGAVGVVQPQPYDQYLTDLTECANAYGVNGSQVDDSCASTPAPTVPPALPTFLVHRHRHGHRWH
jgi:hypothetical protein